ncbi:hypothetical protein BGZ65_004929 [Modicella reniformis]|uniref:Eukaryotic translation initiation factor 4E n=1 Tax=Modicella reniformis TaxID=1440133 RepID=A0A9P6IQ65_9FUNG|nr:hypothetical protein BGZ65_004929 [Modicella reniformis]
MAFHYFQIDQVELFARYFNWIEKPHKMEYGANYHLFKDGIKPMWEDPANANGGRWSLTLVNKDRDLLDRCWMELSYALVGEQLDAGDDICGAVLSRRIKADRLAVWVRDKENVEAINGIGKRLIKILDLAKENISLEFMITTDTRSSGMPKSYISLETIKRELAREAMTQSFSEADTTPSLYLNSVSIIPAAIIHVEGNKEKEESVVKENQDVSSAAGLLISVEGSDDLF